MFGFGNKKKNWAWPRLVKKLTILLSVSLAVLFTAQSCSLPGFQNNNTSKPDITYGVMKKGDPNIQTSDFVRANAVQGLSQEVDTTGLKDLSILKMVRYNSDIFYVLTSEKGVFRSNDSGRLWTRQYIFPIQADLPIQSQIQRNDDFVYTDLAVDPNSAETIYVSGLEDGLGKIYKTTDGGQNFRQMYSEVDPNIPVVLMAIHPTKPDIVLAVLEGGSIIRSLDRGNTWQKSKSFRVTPAQIKFHPEENLAWAVIKNDGVSLSRDDGLTWEVTKLKKLPTTVEKRSTNIFNLLENASIVRNYEALYPVVNGSKKGWWILQADEQIWMSPNFEEPFSKILLPLENRKVEINSLAIDPVLGADRIYLGIQDKLFITNNSGKSWEISDKINIDIGFIVEIVIEPSNNNIVYLGISNQKTFQNFNFF